MVNYFKLYPEADVLYGNCGIIDRKGNIQDGLSYYHEWDLEYAVEYCDYCIPQPAAFIRRRILEKVGWLDENFVQKKDHELWLRIGLVGNIKHIPCILAYERNIRGISFEAKTIVPSCVQVTKKFFSLSGIPLKIKRKKRRAISNSYLRGANYAYLCGIHAWPLAILYVFRAALVDPLNLPYVISRSTLPLRRKLCNILKR